MEKLHHQLSLAKEVILMTNLRYLNLLFYSTFLLEATAVERLFVRQVFVGKIRLGLNLQVNVGDLKLEKHARNIPRN